jgi:hypothetical protein
VVINPTQDVPDSILTGDLEIGVIFAEPAVQDFPNGDSTLPQPKGLGPLIRPVP